jgi:hypothetical protein
MSRDPKSKDLVFYLQLEERPPTAGCMELLEKYSKIPKDEISDHVAAVVG